jgi:hypothetical protein
MWFIDFSDTFNTIHQPLLINVLISTYNRHLDFYITEKDPANFNHDMGKIKNTLAEE